jgi:hypothetical protein
VEWLKHVITTDQTKVAEETFQSNEEGRRNVGRPGLIWLEYTENDL